MAHFHQDSETYYLDQLCLTALSGAFGGVCLSLFTWQRPMLNIMLASQFHLFVLMSGILLVVLAVLRGVILWKTVGLQSLQDPCHDHCHYDHAQAHNCPPDHEHPHPHDHAHAPDDGPGHEHLPDHGQQQSPGQGHHEHDHDHDWAPWRYVILLVPIILFLLGLPNKLPDIRAELTQIDMSKEAASYAALVAVSPEPLVHLVTANGLFSDSSSGHAPTVRFLVLEQAAASAESRSEWNGKRVQVVGQYRPLPNSDRQFSLVRLRITCCAADVVALKVPMISKEPLTGLATDQWVKVTGRVDFRHQRNSWLTVLQVPGRNAIFPSEPEANPYEQ